MTDLKCGPQRLSELINRDPIGFNSPGEKEIVLQSWRGVGEAAQNSGRTIPLLNMIPVKKTALVVVDMQRAFLESGAAIEVPPGRSLFKNINLLSDAFRFYGGTVMFLRYLVDEECGLLPLFEGKSYLPGGRESPIKALNKNHQQFQIHPGLNVKDKDIIVNKRRYSGVVGSNMVGIFRRRGITNIVITGVTTDVCAGNTAENLMQSDFHVVMVWDGTAALSRLVHEMFLARFFLLYGDVMPTEEVLRRITR